MATNSQIYNEAMPPAYATDPQDTGFGGETFNAAKDSQIYNEAMPPAYETDPQDTGFASETFNAAKDSQIYNESLPPAYAVDPQDTNYGADSFSPSKDSQAYNYDQGADTPSEFNAAKDSQLYNLSEESASNSSYTVRRGSSSSSAQPGVLRDYQHAEQLFVGDMGRGQGTYAYAPKFAFMFHLFFDFLGGTGDQTIGMLAKQCSLPKLTFDTKTMNNYNRPYIIQTKVRYDPINITFHDDNSDAVRKFLYDYYSYYYADPSGLDWGYRGNTKDGFLSSIRIYSLTKGKFSEYTLINPIIKNYANGDHNSYESAGIMQHQMTVEYEGILLKGGTTSQSTVKGFANLHYDRTTSPHGMPAPYPGGDNTGSGSGQNDYVMYRPGLYDKIVNSIYDNPAGKAAAEAVNLLSILQRGIRSATQVIDSAGNAVDAFSNGDVAGGLFSTADAIASAGRLAASAESGLSKLGSTNIGQTLTSSTNAFAPVSIPSVGSFMASVGSTANSITGPSENGINVLPLTGISPAMPVGGLGRLSEEVMSYATSSDSSDTLMYNNVSNIQQSMPDDMITNTNAVQVDSVDATRTIGTSYA